MIGLVDRATGEAMREWDNLHVWRAEINADMRWVWLRHTFPLDYAKMVPYAGLLISDLPPDVQKHIEEVKWYAHVAYAVDFFKEINRASYWARVEAGYQKPNDQEEIRVE